MPERGESAAAVGHAVAGGREQLRVAIVGAGFIGAVHARSARLAGAHLAGVAASTAERSLEAAHRLGAELGTIRLLHGGYLQDWLSTPDDDNWRVEPELGGASRAFADIGSHWCDLAEFITGDRIAAVCAQTATVVSERTQRHTARAFEAHSNGGDGGPPVRTQGPA